MSTPRVAGRGPALMRLLLGLTSDERVALGQTLGAAPRPTDLYHAVQSGSAYARARSVSPAASALVQALQRPASLSDILSRLPLASAEVDRGLVALADHGLLAERPGPGQPIRRARPPFAGVLSLPRDLDFLTLPDVAR